LGRGRDELSFLKRSAGRLARTLLEILAPKYLFQIIFVNFCLVLISTINHLLYLLKLELLPYQVCPKPSNLRQTGPKNR